MGEMTTAKDVATPIFRAMTCPTCGGSWAHPPCPVCDLEFSDWLPDRDSTAVYCTPTCKTVANQRAYRKRQAEAVATA